MAVVTSNGISNYNYAFDNSIAVSTVNLQEYSYFIEVFIPGGSSYDLTLTGVRVDYEYPGYLPCVTK